MSIRLKTAEEIAVLREGGRHLAQVLDTVEAAVAPGVSMVELDAIAYEAIQALGDKPAFKGYRPASAYRPFPDTLCVAVNNIVVHGIPSLHNHVLQVGDIVGIDTGLVHQGMIVDSGRTIGVGEIDGGAKKLISVTKDALMIGIKAAQPGGHIGDIGAAIEEFIDSQGEYGIVEMLCGHGVGHEVHEDPQIPNYGRRGSGDLIRSGMVLAIEPMVNEGSADVIFERDGYTVRTRDGKRSAHWEHTIVVTDQGPEILTKSS